MRILLVMATMVALLTSKPSVAGETVKLEFKPEKANLVVGAGEAVVVAVFSNQEPGGGDNHIWWARYDVQKHQLENVSRGSIGNFVAAYSTSSFSTKKGRYTSYVGVVPAGDYILFQHDADNLYTNGFCFGAPVFHVEAGSVSYVGGYRTYSLLRLAGLHYRLGLGWDGNIERDRSALSSFPELQTKLVSASIVNGGTFPCGAGDMYAYTVPGVPNISVAISPNPPNQPTH